MSEPRDDGGPAFPATGRTLTASGSYLIEPGMSLRDYFAGQALAGIMAANQDYIEEIAAGNAYSMAHAMLLARKA